MKNKSRYPFLLTALVAASACVMQAHAGCSEYMIYNASEAVNISSIPSSGYLRIADFPISLSYAKKYNESFSFSMRLVDQKDDDALPGVFLRDLRLSNADEIDASILRKDDKFGHKENSVYADFTPIAEGTVTLTYEGDVTIDGTERHITVDEVITVGK